MRRGRLGMRMHIDTSILLALAVVGFAWIGRLQAPPRWINAAAWTFSLLITLVILITGLVGR